MSFLSSLLEMFSGQAGEILKKEEIRLQNAYKRLKTIHEVYYPKFKNEGCSPILWFCRKDLEAARFYYSGGKEGYRVDDDFTGWSISNIDPRYVELKKALDDAEAKVKEMESSTGYEFAKISDNSILFREKSSGRLLSPSESNLL